MKHLKTYNLFEKVSNETDMKFSDRDMTNKYHCESGWVRYSDTHKDSYIDIEKYFDISFDHLGWILEDLVNTCDLFYSCSKIDDSIVIDFYPRLKVTNQVIYMSEFSNFPPREEDVLSQLLNEIENKLNDFHLTIRFDDGYDHKWNFFLNSSTIRLKIIRK